MLGIRLHMLVLAGCFINAVSAPLAVAFMQNGIPGFMDKLLEQLLAWVIACFALFLLSSGDRTKQLSYVDKVFCMVVCCVLLVPSAQIAWCAGGGLALRGAYLYRHCLEACSGFLIFAALAFRAPILAGLLHLFSAELLWFDAAAVLWAMQVFDIDAQQLGNVISNGDHQLAIMTGCSSFTNLSSALLIWFALTRGCCHSCNLAGGIAVVVLVVAIMATNILRLMLMGLDAEQYVYFHDGEGRTWFEYSFIFLAVLISAVGVWFQLDRKNA